MSESWINDKWQWLLVGSTAVVVYASIDRSVDTRRPRYETQADCLRDWNDPRDCESGSDGTSSAGGSGGGRVWYGPDMDSDGKAYHADGRVTTGHNARPLSATSFRGSSVTRGGFGVGFSRGG